MPGVSMVVIQGGQEPEFEVRPDPGKLIQTATTVPNILEAIGRTNLIESPGLMEYNHQLVLGLVSGQVRTPEEISKIVVKTTPAGVPVRIGDIATVAPSVKPVYTIVTANEKPAVLLSVYRQPDGNTVTVADAVHAEIDRVRRTLPPGVQLRPFYDQSELVNSSITSVRDAILLGLVLASLIMVLFLRDWGTSLVAGLVIPATIAITFIALRLLGESFNLMTLGGLAAAVGLVIDDAIVVVENIVMHRDTGHEPRRRDPQRDSRNPRSTGRLHHHAHCGVPAADLDHRRHRRVLPRPGDHRQRGALYFAGAGAHLDADAQSLPHPPAHPRARPNSTASSATS